MRIEIYVGVNMGAFEEYRALYDDLISKNAKMQILKYDSVKKMYEYKPYSHTVSNDAIDKLADLIIDDMVFYAFSEEEILDLHKRKGILNDLRVAAKYAYDKRLPHRTNADTDGTPGEILLDILIQVYEPISQKLIARAKYKQLGDNDEIKGYDALYFTKDKKEISLWLGQVKTGDCNYCTKDIIKDLNKKYVLEYFCEAIYYIADKAEKSCELIKILDKINDICIDALQLKWGDDEKKKALFDLIKKERIMLKIPCVLAYTADIYSDVGKLENKVKKSIANIVKKLDTSSFLIAQGLKYEIIFYVFPIRNVKQLRSKIIEFKKAGG